MRTVRVNKDKVTSRNSFIVNPIPVEKVKKSKKMKEAPSIETTHEFYTCLSTLTPAMTEISGFMDCFSFSHVFSNFLLFLDLETKGFKFCTRIWIKLLPSKDTSLLPLFQKFWKILGTLTVNETKVTLGNAFILNLFALETEKKF